MAYFILSPSPHRRLRSIIGLLCDPAGQTQIGDLSIVSGLIRLNRSSSNLLHAVLPRTKKMSIGLAARARATKGEGMKGADGRGDHGKKRDWEHKTLVEIWLPAVRLRGNVSYEN